jgi:hypothetical protein
MSLELITDKLILSSLQESMALKQKLLKDDQYQSQVLALVLRWQKP